MSPLSSDPVARAKQLANLQRGRPGSRPPAPPAGNDRARTHGAYGQIARDQLDAEGQRIIDALAADAPLRDPCGSLPAADGVAVSLLAACLIRLRRVEAYLVERGMVDADGDLRPAVELEGKLRREALDAAEALGMTPRSRARLGLELVRAAATAEDAAAAAEARARLDERAAGLTDGEGDGEA